ncbi:MAG: hypothetical protein FJX44_08440 [Alphaproteobacteria bacterium]|nr:hypothetical protein [Alphaproteobacteria bacterium]
MTRLGSTTILAFCVLALTMTLLTPDLATAEPSEEQVAAIKANCRSDFMSKCRGVPRGGAEAMQCLKNNFANVSSGCQQALKPLMAAAPAKAPAPAPAAQPEPAPAPQPEPAATPAPAAPAEPKPETAATPPPSAPVSESAPAAPPKAAATPAAPQPAAKAPAKAKIEEPAAVQEPAATAKPAAPPVAAEETTIIGFIPPRKKLMILKNCRQDIDTHCGDVSYGEGRQLSCLISHKASLSPDCQGALAKLTR